MSGFLLISMPPVMAHFGYGNEWMLPLNIKIFGIDSKSSPGFEIHYAFCMFSISSGALFIGGECYSCCWQLLVPFRFNFKLFSKRFNIFLFEFLLNVQIGCMCTLLQPNW